MDNTDPILYSIKGVYRSLEPIFVARASGFTFQNIPMSMKDFASPDFKTLNPFQKCPILITNEGVITETMTIMRYMARKTGKLFGKNEFEAALINQWLEYANLDMDCLLVLFCLPYLGVLKPHVEHSKQSMSDGAAMFKKKMEELNKYLENKKYFVGDELSIADICIFCKLYWPFSYALSEKDRKPFTHLFRWYTDLAKQDWFLGYMGRLRVCSKPFPLVLLPGEEKVDAKKKKCKDDNKAAAEKKEGTKK